MSDQTRKARGRRTEKVVAQEFRENGWPYAEPTGASRPGEDILGVPGLSIEVKARTGFNPLAWTKQPEKHNGLPFAIMRCNGQGEDAGEYIVLIKLKNFFPLLRAAGYGSPEV